MATTHMFDVEIAQKVGIEEAILFQFISFWVEKNRANGTNERDGKYWTFNSIKAFNELFPYMTENTIRRALKRLEEQGMIETSNYNNNSRNRTKWYTLTGKAENAEEHACKCEKSQMHLAKFTNATVNNHKCINTVIYKTDKYTDINTMSSNDETDRIIDYLNEKTGSRYRHTENSRKHIRARLNDGFTLADCMQVIDTKSAEWLGNEKMAKYLRPETLFGSKFENYLSQQSIQESDQGTNNPFLQALMEMESSQ